MLISDEYHATQVNFTAFEERGIPERNVYVSRTVAAAGKVGWEEAVDGVGFLKYFVSGWNAEQNNRNRKRRVGNACAPARQ